MNLIKKIDVVFFLFFFMLLLVSCNSVKNNEKYDIYIFNSKYEIADKLEELANLYEKETDIKIKTYTTEIGSEHMSILNEMLSSKEKPTIFSVQGISELNEFINKETILDLSTSSDTKFKIFQDSIPSELKLNLGNENYGIPYGIDGYGFIVDRQIIDELFEEDVEDVIEVIKLANYNEFENLVISLDSYITLDLRPDIVINKQKINLKEVKSDLIKELDGVFSVVDIESWNYVNNLINISLNTVFNSQISAFNADILEVKELYNPLRGYAKTMNLIHNHMVDSFGKIVIDKSYLDANMYNYQESLKTFANNKSIFLQQSSGVYSQLEDLNKEKASRLELVPIKIDLEQNDIYLDIAVSDFNKSIPVFVSNYYAINSKVSKKEQELAMEFLYWLNRSEEGRGFMINEFNFIPYDGIEFEDEIKNALGSSVLNYQEDGNMLSNSWLGMPYEVLQSIQFILKRDYLTISNWIEREFSNIADLIIQEWVLYLEDNKK